MTAGTAVELFMVQAAEAPVEAVAAMRLQPSWSDAEAAAHALAYEAAVMGPGNALPTARRSITTGSAARTTSPPTGNPGTG
jgi:hypothetical protein